MNLRTLRPRVKRIEWPKPDPPEWALAAGLPEPRDDEDFCCYLSRLGLDCEELTRDLTAQTAVLANIRLDSYLMRSLPEAYSAYVDSLCERWLTPARHRYLRRWKRAWRTL